MILLYTIQGLNKFKDACPLCYGSFRHVIVHLIDLIVSFWTTFNGNKKNKKNAAQIIHVADRTPSSTFTGPVFYIFTMQRDPSRLLSVSRTRRRGAKLASG